METIEKQKGEKGNNSDNSQLNLCELLKGHEEETFYSLAHGDVMLDHVSPTIDSCIVVKIKNGDKERFYRDGKIAARYKNAIHRMYANLFCDSYEEYRDRVSGGLFPEMAIDPKTFLENYFKIDLTI